MTADRASTGVRLLSASWDDRRSNQRRLVDVEGTIKTAGTSARPVRFLDVSSKGCRVQDSNCSRTTVVFVMLGGFGPLRATVTWTGLREAGLHFDERLHPSVINHLANLPREVRV